MQCQRFNGYSANRNQRQHYPSPSPAPSTSQRGSFGLSQRQEHAPIQCESGASGLYAHPLDCRKFLNCDHGRTFIQDCGPGTAFNDIHKVCDWPHKVDCGTRPPEGNVIVDGTNSLNTGELNTAESQHEPFYGQGMIDTRMGFDSDSQTLPQSNNQQHHQYPAHQQSSTQPQNRQHWPQQQPQYNRQQQPTSFTQQSNDGTISNSLQSSSSLSPSSFNAPNTNELDDLSPKAQVINLPSQDLQPPFRDPTSNGSETSNGGVQSRHNPLDENWSSRGQHDVVTDVPSQDLLPPFKESNDRTGRVGESGVQSRHNPLDRDWANGQRDAVETNFVVTTESNIDHSILSQRKPSAPRAFPDFHEMARRIDEENKKRQQNQNQNPLPQESTASHIPLAPLTPLYTTERQPPSESATKVYHIYPSGFETMGAKCQADRTGLMAHPYDCSRYVHCVNGQIQVRTCEAGYMFNPTLNRCDLTQNVRCNIGAVPTSSPGTNFNEFDESVNEIHNEDRDEKKPFDFGLRVSTDLDQTERTPQSNQSPYFVPDMSVLPLESNSHPQYTYPDSQHRPSSHFKPSQGGDVPLADFDDQANRDGKGLFHSDPRLNYATTTQRTPSATTGRQHVMRIPSGKEHAMPIYQRPTTTKSPSYTYSSLQSANQVSYQPFAKPVSEPEQTDYVPVSEALKLLLRPYVTRNDTKDSSAPPDHMNKIENKLLDMIDNNTNHSKTLEQDSLAAAALNENIAVRNLPDVPRTQVRSGFDTSDENDYETTTRTSSSFDTHLFNHKPHRTLGENQNHNDQSPSPSEYRPTYYKPGTNEPIHIAFPGPHSQSHPLHGQHTNSYHQPHHTTPPPYYNSYTTNIPPTQHANTNYHSPPSHHQQNYGPNYQTNAANFGQAYQNRNLGSPQQTPPPATASAPPPNWYSTNDKPINSAQVRFGKSDFEISTCEGQFDCGTGFCIPFSRVSTQFLSFTLKETYLMFFLLV